MGPIGNGFVADPGKPIPLLIGGGVGLPPMVYLAEALSKEACFDPIVMLGSEVPFPFRCESVGNRAHWNSVLCQSCTSSARIARNPQSSCQPERPSGLLCGLCDGTRCRVDNVFGSGYARKDSDLRLRTDTDARGNGPTGAAVFASRPGFAGGIHGVRSRRMRRMRGTRDHA